MCSLPRYQFAINCDQGQGAFDGLFSAVFLVHFEAVAGVHDYIPFCGVCGKKVAFRARVEGVLETFGPEG